MTARSRLHDEDGTKSLCVSRDASEKNWISVCVQAANTDSSWESAIRDTPGRGTSATQQSCAQRVLDLPFSRASLLASINSLVLTAINPLGWARKTVACRSETASGRAGGDSRSKRGSGLESVGRSGMGSPARRKTKSVVPSSSPSTSSESSSSRGAPMASHCGGCRVRVLDGREQ